VNGLVGSLRLAVRRHRLRGAPRPDHVGVVMDGNRRWARAAGHASASVGHRVGAEHVGDVLRWGVAWGVEHLTVYVLSADNIRRRDAGEIRFLAELIEEVIPDRVLAHPEWRLHVAGDLGLLPATTRAALGELVAATQDRPRHLTLAIGYDGRRDIVEAVRLALRTTAKGGVAAGTLTEEAITAALGGGPRKEIDLVIRTSGEQRMSGFLPWQSSGAEIVTSRKMWPAFTEVDFVEALVEYARRARRRTG
jgi:short-chain Z-isoprenyl diphosphate synthase